MKKIICKNCGTVNEVSDKSLAEDDDWLQCALPEGFEWSLPAGKITPIIIHFRHGREPLLSGIFG